jgi:hypothetical protein
MTGRRWILVVGAVAVLAAVSAVLFWRPWAAPELSGTGTTTPSSLTADLNGVVYELPWAADPKDQMAVATEFLKARTATGFRWSNGTHTFEVANAVGSLETPQTNEVSLNSKKYGRVNSGDHVKLTQNGVLYVNGVERKPE